MFGLEDTAAMKCVLVLMLPGRFVVADAAAAAAQVDAKVWGLRLELFTAYSDCGGFETMLLRGS